MALVGNDQGRARARRRDDEGVGGAPTATHPLRVAHSDGANRLELLLRGLDDGRPVLAEPVVQVVVPVLDLPRGLTREYRLFAVEQLGDVSPQARVQVDRLFTVSLIKKDESRT